MHSSQWFIDGYELHRVWLDVTMANRGSPAFIRHLQNRRLARLLELAGKSPVYAERLKYASEHAQALEFLPFIKPVTKKELMPRFDDWVLDPRLNLRGVLDFLHDDAFIGQAYLGHYTLWESSGTSGQPGVFVQDMHAMAVYDALQIVRHRPPRMQNAFWWQSLMNLTWARERYAMVTATGGHFASIVNFERWRHINSWFKDHALSLSIMQPMSQLVERLNAFQPNVLATYPTVATVLAREAKAGRLRLDLNCVLTGGETLSHAMRRHIETAFSTVVRSSYGGSEFLNMAWECDQGQLHLNTDWFILEPVDDAYRPVPAGEESYTCLLTNLANHVQPLIRYDLGDRIRLPEQACACGSPYPVVQVQGRDDDVFEVDAASGKGKISLLPMALCTVIEEQCGIFDFQLCQSGPRALLLRLAQEGGQAAALAVRCQQALQDFVSYQGAASVEVQVETGVQIPRGKSGKTCRVE